MSTEQRVGIGYDVHAFGEGRKLVLGGIEFPGETGLAGHSDADVVAHAVIDALLGAAGLGDIGQQFPDTDERFRDADSIGLLKEALLLVAAAGWKVGNVDLTVQAERPRISQVAQEMQERLADTLGIFHAHVNVKATTGEGLGFIGRGEGIAAIAVVLIQR
jgi:2-C-methyl-D-erythritol 2,4-cyclodiphosphate synthase